MNTHLAPRVTALLAASRLDPRDGQGLPVPLTARDYTAARYLERRGLGWITGTRHTAPRFCANGNGIALAGRAA